MVSFGPVPSRRLGKSLGINNILSPKVCSYGCVYCQVGHNVEKSISRESFFQPEYIYRKVEEQRDYYDLWGDIFDNIPRFGKAYRRFMKRKFG